jgi:hypothetical protein
MNVRNPLISLTLGLLLAGAAGAQDCVDYGAGVHVTASVAHSARYLAANGDFIYLSSLNVIDVSVPGQPVDLGAFAGPDGTVKDMLVADGFLVAAFAPGAFGTFGGVAVFDLTSPGAPVLAGSVATPGIATAVSAGGGRAYVRSDDGYVTIVDIGDPAAPTVVGSLGAGAVTAFDAAGAVVYAWDSATAMMRVFNAADAAAPRVWTTWSEPGVEDVELAFGQLYVYANGRYRVFGLADPLAPAFVRELPVIDRAVDFIGNQAAAYGFPARFWDMTNPDMPVSLPSLPFVVHAGFISGARALVGISTSFAELAIGDGSSTGATGSLDLDQAPTGLASLGNHALVIKEMGLDVVDASVCDAPVTVASLLLPGLNDGYAVAGDRLYILVRSGAGSSLQVVDLRSPSAPVVGALVPASGSRLQGLVAAGNWLYTARGSVIVPIDISDPANPVVGAGISGLGFGNVAAATGDLLVTANDWEIRTYSLAVPGVPALLGVLQTELNGRGLLLQGSLACLLHDTGVALFDVSDPGNIVPRGALEVPGTLDGFALAADHLYVEGNGIHVIDITDPAAPVFAGSLPYGNDTYAPLAVMGECLWFAQYVSPNRGRVNLAPLACAAGAGGGGGGTGNEPLAITIDVKPGSGAAPFNCRRPRGVVPVAILSVPGFDALSVDHASVRFGPGQAAEEHVDRRRDDRGGVRGHGRDDIRLVPRRHEVDVDRDGDLDLLLHFSLEEARIPCDARSVALTGRTFAGHAVAGSDVVRALSGGDNEGRGRDGAGDKAGPVAAPPQLVPNPFNPTTHVRFSLEQPGRVTVAVYDLSGRRVALVTDRVYDAGPQAVLWAGCDDSGRAVSSGVYFVRVEGAGTPVNLRAVLLR